jgi:hypothetical protein
MTVPSPSSLSTTSYSLQSAPTCSAIISRSIGGRIGAESNRVSRTVRSTRIDTVVLALDSIREARFRVL